MHDEVCGCLNEFLVEIGMLPSRQGACVVDEVVGPRLSAAFSARLSFYQQFVGSKWPANEAGLHSCSAKKVPSSYSDAVHCMSMESRDGNFLKVFLKPHDFSLSFYFPQ